MFGTMIRTYGVSRQGCPAEKSMASLCDQALLPDSPGRPCLSVVYDDPVCRTASIFVGAVPAHLTR